MSRNWLISQSWNDDVLQISQGTLPINNANTIGTDLIAWNNFKPLLEKSVKAGQTFSNGVVFTYSLVYASVYTGGVLAPNGDIHFVPHTANRGQKVAVDGTVSTYSLVYTTANAYGGGVLAPNGDIHFVPLTANRGQKVSTGAAIPFNIGTCCSSFFNKL